MTTVLIVSQIFLWIALIALGLMVLALARQVGVLHERVAPAGALAVNSTIKVGDPAPVLDEQALDGQAVRVGGASDRSTLLFFLSPDCPVCKSLLPALKSSLQAERSWVTGVLASDGASLDEHRAFVSEHDLAAWPYVVSERLGRALGVTKLPYAALIDESGVVRSLGIVNSREHVDSLFNAKELGVASIQEFISRRSA